jgi:dUTP pyrophosphatase
MQNKITKIYIKKLENFPKDLDSIRYATENSSGIDLIAAIENNMIIKPMERILVPTGISIAFEESDLEAQIRSRSGLAYKNGVIVFNSPGTIDNDYRGEIKIILANFGDKDFIIEPKMRIAQMVISRYIKSEISFIENFQERNLNTERGEGGFGSTGLKS